MMAESQQNPLHDPDGELEQIGKLSREIREGILNLIDTRGQEEQEELNELRTAALIRRAPESTYATLLFRKYADIANDIKDSQHQRGDSIIGDIGTLAVYEPDDEKRLVGWDALRTNIFWLRMGTATLAFISYVLMASVKFINYAKYHPFRYFSEDCDKFHMSGWFDLRPYRFVIATGVLIYLYSFLFALYYLLPVNTSNNKFIPGLDHLLSRCYTDPADVQSILLRSAVCCKSFSKMLECISDALALFLAVVAFLVAAIYLERSTRFQSDGDVEYYSLGSFYATYTHTNPSCVNSDPTQLIRASLALLFFAGCAVAVCFQVSLQAVRHEWGSRLPPTSGGGSSSSSSRHSGGGGKRGRAGRGGSRGFVEEQQPFRALPLSVEEEEEVEEEEKEQEQNVRWQHDDVEGGGLGSGGGSGGSCGGGQMEQVGQWARNGTADSSPVSRSSRSGNVPAARHVGSYPSAGAGDGGSRVTSDGRSTTHMMLHVDEEVIPGGGGKGDNREHVLHRATDAVGYDDVDADGDVVAPTDDEVDVMLRS